MAGAHVGAAVSVKTMRMTADTGSQWRRLWRLIDALHTTEVPGLAATWSKAHAVSPFGSSSRREIMECNGSCGAGGRIRRGAAG